MSFSFLLRPKWGIPLGISLAVAVYLCIPVSSDDFKSQSSLKIVSRERESLGSRSNTAGALRDWVSIDEYPEHVLQAVILAEDKRFYFHPGFDPVALGGALYSLFHWKEKVRGGSTITQQLVRIHSSSIRKLPKWIRKSVEILVSIRYTLWLSKKEILEAYLNSVTIRSNYEGFPAASLRYFKKHIRFLSMEEGIALVVLIRSNSPNIDMFVKRVEDLNRRLNIETPLQTSYLISSLEFVSPEKKKEEELKSENHHFKFWIQSLLPDTNGILETRFSNEVNRHLHNIVLSELDGLKKYNVSNASVVVLEIPEKDSSYVDLIGMIGSRNFFEDGFGQVNGSLAYRDAGSTLKPLLYASAMEKKLISVNSILNDENRTFILEKGEGSYTPRNADLKFWGDMTVAEALANSRNIPAVEVIQRLGVPEFLDFLKRSGMNHLKEKPNFYGQGLSLGTGGASLFQLTRAYASFPLDGKLPQVFLGKNQSKDIFYGKTERLFSKETAEEISFILKDSKIRSRAFGNRSFMDFPFPVSVKTGTSKDFRNSWTIGYTKRYVVGAWVGNFSGEKTMEVSGSWGAGRIFHSVMRYLMAKESDKSYVPSVTEAVRICRKTGKLAKDVCPHVSLYIRPSGFPKEFCLKHGLETDISEVDSVSILTPSDGQIFIYNPNLSKENQQIPVRLKNYSHSFAKRKTNLYLNRSYLVSLSQAGEARIPIVRGKHVLSIQEDGKEIQEINFQVR